MTVPQIAACQITEELYDNVLVLILFMLKMVRCAPVRFIFCFTSSYGRGLSWVLTFLSSSNAV